MGAAALVALAGMGSTSVVASAAPTAAPPTAGAVAGAVQLKQKPPKAPNFGRNVTIFTPDMPTRVIKKKFDEIHAKQVDNEMGTDRYGLFFMPGTYGTATEPLQVKVGYYTEVAGLGANPGDVQINGAIEVYNRCFDDPTNPEFVGCFALNNFWRGLSNL
ncbi:MAG TPA: hypothetical protein VES03_05270, partial [Motilibacterales bacterium]|nr:hypothetical protein [Motilibacterales bacterium]